MIRRIRELTDKPFAVDLLLPASLAETDVRRDDVRAEVRRSFPEQWDFLYSLYERFELDINVMQPMELALGPTLIREQVNVLLEERVPVFAAGLGDPAWVVEPAHEAGILVMGLAGSPRHAERQSKAGVDMIVAQGYEAGGHTGVIGNFPLIPQVVDRVGDTPVLAAGAIADGRAVAAAMALGAQGVWVGTAFLFANEANLHADQRVQLTAVQSSDLQVSRVYTGKPSRIIPTPVGTLWNESGIEPLPMPHQSVIMEDFVTAAEAAGRWDLINNPVGQIAGMLSEHEPAADIVARLASQAVEAIQGLNDVIATDEA
jgi:NAD(P)H-dependent flavin oxidoreductase YrpB (nitropropane dioxygenase family)